jgi:D-alanine-D-alanine ligase
VTIIYHELVSLIVSTHPVDLPLRDLHLSHSSTIKMLPNHLKIALVYDSRSTYRELGYSEIDCADLGLDEETPVISAALEHHDHHVTLTPGIKPLVQQLAIGRATEWDLVFNVSEGFYGTARESQVPGLLEAY